MSTSFLNELNQKQQEAVRTLEGPVMVVAGPGSGKTRVLTYRIAHLIKIGVPAYQILALTFTNKAASEMKERIVQLVGADSRNLWMGTFHSIFARLLRVECEKLGFQKNFTIYDSNDSLVLVKHIMRERGIPTQQFSPQAIRSRISGSKNQLVQPQSYAERTTDIFEEKTAIVYLEYQKQLKQNNAMDFDDLLLKPIELFAGNKKILAKYQDRFRFILIDEYQDTNRAQYVLIKHLAEQFRNICVVGDDAQSIYAFRGADIRNILDFQRDYPDAKIIRLEQNYRSTKNILSAADQVIKKNVDQISKDLWTENTSGDAITILGCEDDRDEAAGIVSHLFEESRRLKIDLKDIAVMYRTNAQSRSIEDSLRRNSIPYVIVGGIEFYQRKEVKDVLAYLRVLGNPLDGENFRRIVNTPARGLGDVALRQLEDSARARGISLLEASGHAEALAALSANARRSFSALASMFQKYLALKGSMSISELSRALVDEIGILRLFKEEGTPESMARWENVQELLSAISEFSADRPDASMEDFLQEVSLVADVDELDKSHNAVTLLTLHSAKGLEFPVVFITGLEEGLLPFYTSQIDRKELEEERRLYYVGITRAMQKLYLTYARVRFRFGEMTYQSPSRFLDEIDQTAVERISTGQRHTPRSVTASARSGGRIPGTAPRKPVDPDSHYFSDESPDYENPPPENLRIGALVEHETFGPGRILNIAGSGESLKAVVQFQSVGRKSLLLKYARLKVL